jgi:DNA-binding winged helix-turn-helix (wHTH) protein/TolB-like protein
MAVLRFGEFELDPETGELQGPAGRTRLQPQPARLLVHLLTHARRLVTREELRRALWSDTEVEFDQGLNFCVRQIRAALGDSPSAPRYIETLPRRGYRFLVPAGEAAPAARPAPSAVVPRLLLAATLLAAGVAGYWWWLGRAGAARSSAARVAILPLVVPGEAPTPYARELAEALVVALAAAPEGIEVIGPATTAALPAGASQPDIARRLGVGFVLSGGPRRDGGGTFLQLVRAADGAHLYARVLEPRDPASVAAEAARELRPLLAGRRGG